MQGARRPIAILVTALILSFVLLTNPGFTQIGKLRHGQLSRVDYTGEGRALSYAGWESSADLLRSLISKVDVVVTANSLQMLYHVGDYDYAIQPSKIPEVEPPEEFGIDSRTGRPTISRRESLESVVAAHDTGIVIGERKRWEHESEGVTSDAADFVYARMEHFPIPGAPGLVVYRWGENTGSPQRPKCD